MFVAASRNQLFTRLLLVTMMVAGAALVAWPLISPASAMSNPLATAVPFVILPLGFLLLLNELVANHLTVKALAISGIVVALAAALRPLGAGVAGIEPMWVVLIVAARALGSTTGFIIGTSSIVVSALATGGIGPWLPYQIVAAGFVSVFAGALPRWQGKAEVAVLVVYAAVSTFFFGWVMNLWFWQSLTGLQPGVAFDAAAEPGERVRAWITYNLTTSLGFDLPRALFTAALVALTAAPLLSTLRRANRKFSHIPAS